MSQAPSPVFKIPTKSPQAARSAAPRRASGQVRSRGAGRPATRGGGEVIELEYGITVYPARSEGKEGAMPGIVVGIDGSPSSAHALDWAMRQAAAVRAPLTVITVHEVPKSYWTGIPVIGPADESLLASLRQAAQDMTQKAAGRLGDAGPVSVTVHAVSGFVVKELVDASQDADLVVLGTRYAGGLTRLLMGSVSSEVVQHSACPVVIVPHKR